MWCFVEIQDTSASSLGLSQRNPSPEFWKSSRQLVCDMSFTLECIHNCLTIVPGQSYYKQNKCIWCYCSLLSAFLVINEAISPINYGTIFTEKKIISPKIVFRRKFKIYMKDYYHFNQLKILKYLKQVFLTCPRLTVNRSPEDFNSLTKQGWRKERFILLKEVVCFSAKYWRYRIILMIMVWFHFLNATYI